MESEFREVYNITECAGCSTNIENSPEANSERAEAIAAWFKKEFSDIFESVIEKKNNNEIYNCIYFKGTSNGIYLLQHTTTGYNYTGIIHNYTKQGVISSHHAYRNEVKLLLVKSKCGFIAGFFRDLIGLNIRMLAINTKAGLVTFGMNGEKAYLLDKNNERTIYLTNRSGIESVYLTKLAIPFKDYICDNIYWSMGISTDNCGIFKINGVDGEFIEIRSDTNINGIVMKLEKCTAQDYAHLIPIWNTETEDN